MSFFDFIKVNIFWLSSILIIIVSVWFTFFEIRKLKKYLNDKNIERNNINENFESGNIDTRGQIKKEEKYSEKELGNLILDISMELKKTNARLKNWRNFGIIIIIIIIIQILSYFLNKL
jgi:cell division protein FtsL